MSALFDRQQVFVTYNHGDADRVMAEFPLLESLVAEVWFDKKIPPGSLWIDQLAEAIDNSDALIFFVSNGSVISDHCLNEIAYAVDTSTPIISVYMEPVELSPGLRLSISRTQAVLRWQLSDDEYQTQLKLALTEVLGKTDGASAPVKKSMHGGLSAGHKVWQVPLHRNLNFASRADVLGRMHDHFQNPDESPVLALSGLGGVGKSQIALEYIHRHEKNHRLVAWIRAESRASIESDFVVLATNLKLVSPSQVSTQAVFAAILRWLEVNDDWLLVFDNVESPEAISGLLPDSPRGKVIVTTRYQSWGSIARSFTVSPFEADDACGYLQSRTGDKDTASAEKLASMLGGLPLALEEACAYVEATGRSLAGYLSLFESHHRSVMSRSRPQRDYSATLQTTWGVAFEALESSEQQAANLLNLLSFLGPDDVPEPLLLGYDGLEDSEVPREIRLDDSLAALRRYSLIKVDHNAVSVHRLVQMVTRDRLTSEARESYALLALKLVEQAFPAAAAVGDQLPDCSRLLPHAQAAIAHCQGLAEADVYAGRLLSRIGTYQCGRGSLAEGVAQLQRAYEIFLKLNEPSSDFAHICAFYGRVRYQAGDLEGALELASRGVEMLDQSGDTSGTGLAPCLSLVAWVNWSLGDFDAARDSVERLISLTASDSDTLQWFLSARAVLSRVLAEQGDLAAALREANHFVEVLGSLGGKRHPVMCGPLMHIGQVLVYAGLPIRAQSWSHESLALGTAAYGEHHPLVAGAHSIMGQVMTDIGEPEKAVKQFFAAFDSVRKSPTLVSQHAALAGCYGADTLLDLDRPDEAAALLADVRSIAANRIAGDANLLRARIDLTSARLACRAGASDSIEKYHAACSALTKCFGEQHLYQVPAALVGAEIFQSNDDAASVRSALERGMAILDRYQLADHPWAAACLDGLAGLASDKGNKESAAELWHDAARRLRVSTGPSSQATMRAEARLQ